MQLAFSTDERQAESEQQWWKQQEISEWIKSFIDERQVKCENRWATIEKQK